MFLLMISIVVSGNASVKNVKNFIQGVPKKRVISNAETFFHNLTEVKEVINC